MKRISVALAVAVVGLAFPVVSGSSRAAPIAPRSAVAGQDGGPAATRVSWHEGRGGDHHKRSGYGRGGMLSHLGHFRSLLGMLGGQGGTGGITSMLGGMGGSGNMGGITSMLGGMGGSGNMGGIASMLGGMGGSGNMGGMASMLGGAGGSGGAEATSVGQVSQSARQACTPDALRLCSDYIPDVAKITACMRAKSAQLSEPCRAAMNTEGAPRSRLAGRGTAARGQDLASYPSTDSAANFSGGGQSFGNYAAVPGYDRSGAVQDLGGAGGFDIGRIIGMARSFGMNW